MQRQGGRRCCEDFRADLHLLSRKTSMHLASRNRGSLFAECVAVSTRRFEHRTEAQGEELSLFREPEEGKKAPPGARVPHRRIVRA